MEAKDKANELISRFTDVEDGEMYIGKAKQCALIAIDEVINSMTVATSIHLPYWQEVKQEINLL